MIPQPLITVNDVARSRAWYQGIMQLESGHGGDEYERLVHHDRIVLQLHLCDAHDHPHLGDSTMPRGNGVAIWFQTDDFDAVLSRIEMVDAEVLDGPLVNPNANHREVWLRDPDGYCVVIAGKPGDL